MIPEEVKQKLLVELEKSGNVYFACNKIGIDRSTFYRWKQNDKVFRKVTRGAIERGRENLCDVAEHALLLNVKDKKMDAIKYVLSHYSNIYKPNRTSKVIIEHRSTGKELPNEPVSRALEDALRESGERMTAEYLKHLGDQARGE